jgi:hypothetical protein
MFRKMTFKTERQANLFRIFLNWKGVTIARRKDDGDLTVTLFSPCTDDQWNDLIYQFGRWS